MKRKSPNKSSKMESVFNKKQFPSEINEKIKGTEKYI